MSVRRRVILLVALALIAGIAARVVFRAQNDPTSSGTASTTPKVATATVRDGSLAQQLTVHGYVGRPDGAISRLAFAQSGVVGALFVAVGQKVHAGDMLAELNRSLLQAQLDQAQADVAAADTTAGADAKRTLAEERIRSTHTDQIAASSTRIAAEGTLRAADLRVESDRSELARQQGLFAAGIIAAKDVATASAQLQTDLAADRSARATRAAASLDQHIASRTAQTELIVAGSDATAAHAQLAAATARLSATRTTYAGGLLRAPRDGIVTAIDKHIGETVDPSMPVVEVGITAAADQVTLNIPMDEVSHVHVGDRVVVSPDGAEGVHWNGVLTSTIPSGDPTAQTVTAVATVSIGDATPGALVSAVISTAQRSGKIVPRSAIVEDPQSGRSVVFMRMAHPQPGDSPFAEKPVVVLAGDDREAVVRGDLQAGDIIAASGSYILLAPNGG